MITKKCCPWCYVKQNGLKHILLKRSVVKCKSCNKYFGITNIGIGILYSTLTLFAITMFIKKFVRGIENPIALGLVIIIVLYIYGLVLNNTVRFKRLKG